MGLPAYMIQLHLNKFIIYITLFPALLFLVISCARVNNNKFISDIDISDNRADLTASLVKKKNTEEVKSAFYDYINNIKSASNVSRVAIQRLADIEYSLYNSKSVDHDINNDTLPEETYISNIKNSISLLKRSLEFKSGISNKDIIYYKLAKQYSLIDEFEQSTKYLNLIVNNEKDSKFYPEAQFRLAEDAFSNKKYSLAELRYTEVISSSNNLFYSKALFKRGWSRYKLNVYHDAIDDFIATINSYNYSDFRKLNEKDNKLFNDALRSIGLSFIHFDSVEEISEFISNLGNINYNYYIFSSVSKIYLSQERYFDAVEILKSYISKYENKDKILAYLDILDIWKNGNYINNYISEMENFYNYYKSIDSMAGYSDVIINTVKQRFINNITNTALYFYNNSIKKKLISDFNESSTWYKRFIELFPDSVTHDIYKQFADLNYLFKHYSKAAFYYELALSEKENKIHKLSLYSLIETLSHITNNKSVSDVYLDKYLKYSKIFYDTYSKDNKSKDILISAFEIAFNNNKYDFIKNNNINSDIFDNKVTKLLSILGDTYSLTKDHNNAITVYQNLYDNIDLTNLDKSNIREKLCLSIFNRAQESFNNSDTVSAYNDIQHIMQYLNNTSIAPVAVFDGITYSINMQDWDTAINFGEYFINNYRDNKYFNKVVKNISVAYLEKDDKQNAASLLKTLSLTSNDVSTKKSSLWRSAQLFEKNKDYKSAIISYEEYANKYKIPYIQNMEAMNKLVELNNSINNNKTAILWQNKILANDSKQSNDRTDYIKSITATSLASHYHDKYSKILLKQPFAKSLKFKKKYLQKSVQLYATASSYNITDISTQATFNIANIYYDFTQAILNSEKPDSLTDEELEQYQILIEDQAFAFEEKAIEFHEANLKYTKSGIYNEWINKSYAKLQEMFPVRYQRENKIDANYF